MRGLYRVISAGLLASLAAASVYAEDTGYPVRFGGRTLSGAHGVAAYPSAQAVVFHSGPSDPIGAAYDTVLIQGVLPDPGIMFEFSRKDAAGNGSPWRRAYMRRHADGRFWAKGSFPTAGGGEIRLRAVADGAGAAHAIDLFAVEVFERRTGKEGGGAKDDAPPAPPAPGIIDRPSWNARPPKEEPVAHVPVRMTQHHTAGRRTAALQESLDEVRFIQDFHQNGRGWSDIGYHFLIDTEGRIFQGRLEGVRGAHVRGANDGNVGIVLMGFHHPPYDHPVTPQQRAALKTIGRWLIGKYPIDPKTYSGHRDLGKTDCPGDGLYSRLDEIRDSFTEPAAGRAARAGGTYALRRGIVDAASTFSPGVYDGSASGHGRE